MFKPEVFLNHKCYIEESICDIAGSSRRPTQWFGAPEVIRRPGNFGSLVPPRYATGCVIRFRVMATNKTGRKLSAKAQKCFHQFAAMGINYKLGSWHHKSPSGYNHNDSDHKRVYTRVAFLSMVLTRPVWSIFSTLTTFSIFYLATRVTPKNFVQFKSCFCNTQQSIRCKYISRSKLSQLYGSIFF